MTGRVRGLEAPDSLGEGWDRRAVWGAALLLLLVHFALAWWAREPGVHVMRDDARYLLLARSLGDLEFRDLHEVGLPPHTLYPPGYPALLLAWSAVTGGGFASHVLLNVLFSTGALGLAFAVLKRVTSPGVALLCLLPLVVNPALVARAGSLRSEAAYAFFSLLALWAVARSRSPSEAGSEAGAEGEERASPRRTALGIGSAVVGTLVRVNGLALVAAMGLRWLWRRRFRAAALLAVATLATVGVWMGWAAGAQQGAHETTYVAGVARTIDGAQGSSILETLHTRVVVRAWRIFVRSLPMTVPVPTIEGTPWDNAVSVIALTASLAAGLLVLLRRWPTAALYLLVYGATLFVWPYLHLRFFEPVLPLLVPAVLLGGAALAGWLRASWRVPALGALALLVTASASAQTAPFVAERAGCGPLALADPPPCLTSGQQDFLRALHVVRREAPADAVFYSTMPEPLYYHTGRRSIPLDDVGRVPPDDLVGFLRGWGVTHLLLTPNSREAARLLSAGCGELALVERVGPRTALLRVPPPDAAPPAASGCAVVAEHERAGDEASDEESAVEEGGG